MAFEANLISVSHDVNCLLDRCDVAQTGRNNKTDDSGSRVPEEDVGFLRFVLAKIFKLQARVGSLKMTERLFVLALVKICSRRRPAFSTVCSPLETVDVFTRAALEESLHLRAVKARLDQHLKVRFRHTINAVQGVSKPLVAEIAGNILLIA